MFFVVRASALSIFCQSAGLTGSGRPKIHPEVPDCDMIVRTSGEERISGFQLWRAAYAELLFLDQLRRALENSVVGVRFFKKRTLLPQLQPY